MAWWLENNLRLIQNNLRDIDANMDIEQLIAELQTYSCNVLMVGAGGITTFYPSELEFTKRCITDRDTFGEIVRKCHANHIRVIARFDFSKTHESLFQDHPDWYFKSADGDPIRYNDTIHTCVNGEYQQKLSLAIIREVLENYPVDGIFFNMFGYQTRDYSNHYYGICHCDSCKKRFLEFCGMALPAQEDAKAPSYKQYVRFQEVTVGEILHNIHLLVRSINPEVAVCTYHSQDVDIIRKESNSAIDRPYPFWIYSGSENVASVRHTWDDKIISNCVINAVDIFYRFMGVSKELTRIRLYQSLAAGSGLDFCIIGVFADYPDRDNFEYVREVYSLHAKNEAYFGKLHSLATVLLIKPAGNNNLEYLGIFKALKEEHILFDVVRSGEIGPVFEKLGRYRVVMIPDISCITDEHWDALKVADITVVVTGASDESDLEKLASIDLKNIGIINNTRSAYLLTREKAIFTSFTERDWVFIDGAFACVATEGTKLLPLVSPANYGPPERCFGHEILDHPGAVVSRDRHYICLPWHPGALYYQHGFEDHKWILTNLLDYYCREWRFYRTNAPNCVEIFFDRCGQEQYLLQLINLSGFNGTTVAKQIPIHDLTLEIPLAKQPIKLSSLTNNNPPPWSYQNGVIKIALGPLEQYEAVVISSGSS